MRKVFLKLSIVVFIFTLSCLHEIAYGQDGEKAQKQTTSIQAEKSKQNDEQDDTQTEKSNIENKNSELQYSLKSISLIVYSGLGIIILVLGVILYKLLTLRKSRLREYIIEQVLISRRIEEKFRINEKNHSVVAKSYTLTEKDINEIVDRVLECKRLSELESKDSNSENNFATNNSNRYLKGKSGNIFNRAEYSPNNSFFRLINETENTAQFEFFGDEAEAIAKRIFSEDISSIVSGSYQTAHAVMTVNPGKIRRLGEQWEVTQPIQIKLI